MLITVLNDLLNFIFPNLCILCDQVLPKGRKLVCSSHFKEFESVPEKYINSLIERLSHPQFSKLYVLYQYDPQIRRLVHLLKYKYGWSLADYFAAEFIITYHLKLYDIVTGVPLNTARERDRGYNQSYLLARAVARKSSLRFEEVLSRKKNTKSQTKLSRIERIKNVSEAFTVCRTVKGLRILLIDDIITTGSTLNACAEVLHLNGAKVIDVAALAAPVLKEHYNLEKTEPSVLEEL